MATIADRKPISSEAWPPFMISPSTSMPSLSVPSGWPAPGGEFERLRLAVSRLAWYTSGPTKLNRIKKTSAATPMTASRLLANSLAASRQPLWMAPTSPPSGARVMFSGVRDWGLGPVRGVSFRRLGQPDPRIRDGQRDVRDQVAQDGQDGADQRVRQEHRVVLVLQAVVEQQPEAVVVEDHLGDEVAGQQ